MMKSLSFRVLPSPFSFHFFLLPFFTSFAVIPSAVPIQTSFDPQLFFFLFDDLSRTPFFVLFFLSSLESGGLIS